MYFLGNFYSVIGLIVIVVIILQAPNFSLLKKSIILLTLLLVVLCIDRPDWFVDLCRRVGVRF